MAYGMTEYMDCPKCGGKAYSEPVDASPAWYYPPYHCDCGWSEMCESADKEGCKNCTEYKYCYEQLQELESIK